MYLKDCMYDLDFAMLMLCHHQNPKPSFLIVPELAVLLSIKETFNGAQPSVGSAENKTVGFAYTMIKSFFITVFSPEAFFTVSVTVYFPESI